MNIYGIYDKLHSVDTTKGVAVSRDYAENKYLLNRNYRHFGGASYRGYIEEGGAYVAPYEGRYGKGVAVAIHDYYRGKTSTKFMRVFFCIKKEGEENDKI